MFKYGTVLFKVTWLLSKWMASAENYHVIVLNKLEIKEEDRRIQNKIICA